MQWEVLVLQEFRVNGEALRLELAPLLREWIVAMTVHVDAATGSTAVLVRRVAFQQGAEAQVEVLHR